MATTHFNAQFASSSSTRSIREWGSAISMMILPCAVFLSVGHNLIFTALVLAAGLLFALSNNQVSN